MRMAPALLLLLSCRDLAIPGGYSLLSASPALIDFGAVRLGDAAERELTVQNDGTEAVTLLAAPLPGLSLAGGAITAAPGATTALLRYRPPGYAPLDTPLLLLGPAAADAPEAARLEIALAATTEPDADADGADAAGAGGGDCDDGDSSVRPGATEVCGDGADQDCDGADLRDCDADGSLPPADCDDADPGVRPGLADGLDGTGATDADGLDNDCDGRTDEEAVAPGMILLTEIQPAAPSVIEICSRHGADLQLQGFDLRSGAGRALLPALTLPAGGCAAICGADQPGCAVRLDLPELARTDRLILSGDAPADQVGWDETFVEPGFTGWSLSSAAFAEGTNDRAAQWCAVAGTPGAPNGPC